MRLNMNDKKFIENPNAMHVTRAVEGLASPKTGRFGDTLEESFALLWKTDRRGDFLSVERIPKRYKLPEYAMKYRDAAAGIGYRVWLDKAGALAVMQRFAAGSAPLDDALDLGFVWCDNMAWAGELALRPPGCDNEGEEELEKRSIVTIGDVAELMMEVEIDHPGLAMLLNATPEAQDDAVVMELLPSRAESLASMRVAAGEDALAQLQRDYVFLFATRDENALCRTRQTWAEAMRSLARWARDREQWNSSAELQAKWVELCGALQEALPMLRALQMQMPPAEFLRSAENTGSKDGP